jgi:hypothetical protein
MSSLQLSSERMDLLYDGKPPFSLEVGMSSMNWRRALQIFLPMMICCILPGVVLSLENYEQIWVCSQSCLRPRDKTLPNITHIRFKNLHSTVYPSLNLNISESLSHIEQPGLQWKEGMFSAKPVWTAEPSIGIIQTLIARHFHLSEAPEVSFFAEGAFNKLYAVACSRGDFIFRVTLPVAPNVKTISESATMSFVRDATAIRTPVVFACDPSLPNELGFEWMMTERMDSWPLREQWHKLSWLKRQLLVQQVTNLITELDRTKWQLIGSIYQGWPYWIGEAVQLAFFIQDHIKLPIYRSPFPSSNSLVTVHMQHLQHDITKQLASSDEDEVEDAEEMKEIYNLLEPLTSPPIPT